MVNQQLAKIFYEIAEYLAMDEVPFKPQAYERAARVIEGMEDDLEEIYGQGGKKALVEIDGVGQNLAEKIEEFIKTGRVKEHIELKKKCPVDLEHLSAVEGLGPKMIKTLYQKLKIRNLTDLTKAAKSGKIAKLPRFGPKTQENILRSIDFVKSGQGRILLGVALPLAEKIENRLREIPGVKEVVTAGSIRRRKETAGDIDILAVAENSSKIMDVFCSLPEVEKILAKGDTKSMVRLHNGLDADLRVVGEESFGAALQYFTGNKDHNIALRQIAQDRGHKLNEYGLFRGKQSVAGKTEQEIYKVLGLQYPEPELRENTGEIEAARKNKLPVLVKVQDVKGDLQMHSTWSDGANSIEEMARAAQKLGRQYIAITDHAGHLAIAGGLNETKLKEHMVEIDKINKKLSGIKILKGAEVDIKKDGALAIADEVLAKLDLVLVAIHDNFKMDKEAMTARICRALSNRYANILAHPSGRLINRREGYAVDWEKVFAAARKNQVAIEINAYPERLDLSWQNVKKAIASGVKLSIGTDAHSFGHLAYLPLGVSVARRGWAEKKDIINCLGYRDLIKFLKK